MTKKNLLVYVVVALLFGAAGLYFGINQKAAPLTTTVAPVNTAQKPSDALFALTMNDANGASQNLAQWKGKALVVNFWAPWCAPCVKEMPELAEVGREQAAKNIHVIGIGMDNQANISQFAKKFNIAFPLYVAGMGGTELPSKLGNPSGGLPFTVLIGPDGQVIKTYLGILKFDELKADLAKIQS